MEGLLEKLSQLGIRKLSQMIPKAGSAIGYGLGGPVGGFAGHTAGSGIQSLLSQMGQEGPYGGLGMAPQDMGLEGQQSPDMMQGLMQQGGQAMGGMAMDGLGSALGGLGGSQQGGNMQQMLQQLLQSMPEEELIKLLQSKQLSQSYQ